MLAKFGEPRVDRCRRRFHEVGLPLTCGFFTLAGQVSNLRPPDPKSGVLPIELPAKGRIERTGFVVVHPDR
jgi:hypothetical protein